MTASVTSRQMDCSLAFCAVVLFTALALRQLHPKKSRLARAAVLCVWFWTTTLWARTTRHLAKDYETRGLPPAVTLWLTLVPQLLSCALLACLMLMKGELSEVLSNLSFRGPDGVAEGMSWTVGGACYAYGQLFTVIALASASPMLVFVVKAVEPLSTALLAIPILSQEFSSPLFLGLMMACGGIIVTQYGGHEVFGGIASPQSPAHGALFTIMAALLANLGFSGRACMVKQAYKRKGSQPLTVLTTLSFTGAVALLLPLGVWPVTLTVWATRHPATFPLAWPGIPFETLGLWVSASISYCIYQCSSLIILDCIAVESHALLVAVKHVFTAVLTAVMVGERLTSLQLLGGLITTVGIVIYGAAPESAPPRRGERFTVTINEKTPLVLSAPPRTSMVLTVIAVGLTGLGTCAVVFQPER